MERIQGVPGFYPSFSTERDLRPGFLLMAWQGLGAPPFVLRLTPPNTSSQEGPQNRESPWPSTGACQAEA